MRISAYGYTSTKRADNLDNIFVDGRTLTDHREPVVKINKVSTADIQVYAVSDAGAMATCIESAVKNSDEFFEDLSNVTEGLEAEGKVEREPIWDLICDSTDKIQARAYRNDEDIQGLSFASLFFQGNRGLAVHAGDCRIYVIRGGRILKITEDHLKVTELLKHKVITPEQLDIRKKDSELTAYVGMDDISEYKDSFFSKFFVFYPDDMFLLCTDGLSDTLRTSDLERLIRSAKNAEPAELLAALADRAETSGNDDYGIVLLKIENTDGEAPARGSATIPQSGSYKNEQPAAAAGAKTEEKKEEKPSAPAPESARTATRQPEPEDDEEDYDEDDEEEGFSLAGLWAGITGAAASVGAFFGRLFKPSDEDEEDDYDESDEDDEDDDDEEESFLSRAAARLREEPKLAAIIAGIAVMLVLLVILCITSCNHDRNESQVESESRIESVAESEEDSVVDSEPESVVESEPESEPESTVESELESEPESVEESEPVTDEPRSYTVKSGDGWGAVAAGMYPEYQNDWNVRKLIYEYLQKVNGTTSLKVGQVLNGPSLSELKDVLGLD